MLNGLFPKQNNEENKGKKSKVSLIFFIAVIVIVIINIILELKGMNVLTTKTDSKTTIEMIKELHIGVIDIVVLAGISIAMLVLKYKNRKGK
jgi:uncharacterized Tic20 family protein